MGLRIAWTLRPAASAHLEDWEARREEVTQVCRQCHTPGSCEVAGRFGNAFGPEAEELLPGVTEPYLRGALHPWRVGVAQEP